MDIKNFLLRKKRELSRKSRDGDDRKRPSEKSSFDDSISKAASARRSIKIMQLYDKFRREN